MGGDNPLCVIVGPCSYENKKLVTSVAEALKDITDSLDVNFIFKNSYSKANRTSLHSFTGRTLEEALSTYHEIHKTLGCPVLTDCHDEYQVKLVAPWVQMLQLPAFLFRQTDLVIALGRTGLPINVKKAQFAAPEDMKYVIEKIQFTGNNNILLTERGSCFGFHDLVVDFRSFPIMSSFGFPTGIDCSHSNQKIGSDSTTKAGPREYAALYARCAVAAGCDFLFLETHPNPPEALSDSACMVYLDSVEALLKDCLAIRSTLTL